MGFCFLTLLRGGIPMAVRRRQGMDSRLRGNDVGGCGNDVDGVWE